MSIQASCEKFVAADFRHEMVDCGGLRLHCAVADTLARCAAPDWQWSHFPAGEARTQETGRRLKRMGLKRGWPDIILISPEGAFYGLELKRRTGSLTEAQEAFAAWCRRHRVPYAVAYGYDEAIAILTNWGALRLRIKS